MADKHPYPGFLAQHIPLLGIDLFLNHRPPNVGQQFSRQSRRAARARHRLGDVHRLLEGPTHVDTGPRGLVGGELSRPDEPVGVQFHVQPLRHIPRLGGRGQPNGEHDQIELLLLYRPVVQGILNEQVLALLQFLDRGNQTFDVADAVLVLGSLIVLFESLPEGSDVVVEDRGF